MKAARDFIVWVVALLLVAGATLLPGRREHTAMLAGEGRHKEAIALLERRLAAEPQNADALAAMARSYTAIGEYHAAVDRLDAYLRLRPYDLAARRRRAELLLQVGSVGRYLDALAEVIAAKPSASEITRLAELYRLHGRFEDELSTLRRYAGTGLLHGGQLERLGALLCERASWSEAQRWLELADRKAPPDASSGRLLLFEVLVRNGQFDLASRRARIWMQAWHSPYLSGKLIVRMAQSGPVAAASRLSFEFADLMPQRTLEMAGLLAQRGQQNIAARLLSRWTEGADHPAKDDLHAYVYTSALVGGAGGPLSMLRHLAARGADAEVQAELAGEIANTFGLSMLPVLRPLLSSEVLLARPIFAARLALVEGNREMARWFLDQTEPRNLSSAQRADWLSLLRTVEADDETFARLARLWGDGQLPRELVPGFADQALRAGQTGMHDIIWSGLRE